MNELKKESNKYYEVMDALKRTKMKHGLCEPVERKACTACMAQITVDRMIDEYQGRKLYPMQEKVIQCTNAI